MKPRNFVLKETNWKTVLKEKFEVAILPWGATEPHNFHLPFGTDFLQSDEVAIRAAKIAWEKGSKTMVLPPVPYGVNTGQLDLPFCISINPSTIITLLRDILTSLKCQGIRKLLIVNSHGGNDFKPVIRQLQAEFPDFFLGLIDWWRCLDVLKYFDEAGDHAGELETSVMMALFPEWVLPLEEAGDGFSVGFRLKGLKEKIAWTPRMWTKVSKDTGVGNPKNASKEKGERFLKDVVEAIASFLVELACVEPQDIYEKL